MSFVQAIDHLGNKRQFTQVQWNLLGKNKGNWREISAQVVENTLSTGEKKKDTVPPQDEKSETPNIDLLKANFFKEAVGISKGSLKDYLDKKHIAYENSFTIKELLGLIGNECNYDTNVLKENF